MAYQDPKTTKIEDWKWRPMDQVQANMRLKEIPAYVQKGYGEFMAEQAKKAKAGKLTPRDLLKAYTITQSSIGRGGLSHATATKTGMKLPNTGGEVRPEGAFSEWLGSPMGQAYLNAAMTGQAHPKALEDIRKKFAPFGKQNDQVDKMAWAAQNAPAMAADMNQMVTGPQDEYRKWASQLRGIAGAKSGFVGSLLGRGDQPTLDARQLSLHSSGAPVGIGAIMKRGNGLGGQEAVDRLSARQRFMELKGLDPSLADHYQHLAHHAIWDDMGGTQTSHEDLVRAMRGYADGGAVSPLKQIEENIKQRGGVYAQQRFQRAADEIPNLGDMFHGGALEGAFTGDNAKAVMTLDPARFEDYATPLPIGDGNFKLHKYYDREDPEEKPMTHKQYIEYLMRTKHYEEVPMLQIYKDQQGDDKEIPEIKGHEGRHRSRAMKGRGDKKTLIQLLPRGDMREAMPRRGQEEYIDAMRRELAMTGNRVRPQPVGGDYGQTAHKRSPILLPDVYKAGGKVNG
jgi:hypothetical protein